MPDGSNPGAADPVAAVRRFNRFYTQTIGVLDRGYLGTDYTVAEGRVLYEIARQDGVSAKQVADAAGLDAGYLSRIVARLERDGVVARQRSARDGRSAVLRVTPHGAEVFRVFDSRAAGVVEDLLAPLTAEERPRLVAAMQTVEALIGPQRRARGDAVTLRPHRQGDVGWVIEQNATVYGGEYGWGSAIESVTARICADFLEGFDPARERCWIAERAGQRLGCVFLVKEPDAPGVARLRLLLLDPAARGLGLGRRLVEASIEFAREAGYREIVLWTHQVLTAARAIYAKTGFELAETWTHDDFGHPEVSETWRLTL
jgi:DNA-binding MarR family transcriptional regulator/GNAT superfamily N-acetyltransferase